MLVNLSLLHLLRCTNGKRRKVKGRNGKGGKTKGSERSVGLSLGVGDDVGVDKRKAAGKGTREIAQANGVVLELTVEGNFTVL